MTTTTAEERMIRDHHPVEVYVPDWAGGEILERQARVFLTTQRVIVWGRTDTGAPVKLLDEAVCGELPRPDRGTMRGSLAVSAAKSGPVYISRGQGCGCHSALKALDAPVAW